MDEPPQPPPAVWSSRLGAWLIDVVLVAAAVSVLGDLLGLGPGLLTVGNPLEVGQHTGLLFAYWTLFESNAGQSPGKLVLDLAVVDDAGRPPSLGRSALQSFGKAFLLPLDVAIGLLAMPGERRRLFNKLSGTRVVALEDDGSRGRRASATEA